MAVPFRRTSKTAKRKRRTHYKLQAPTLVVCKETGEFTLPHRVTKNSGYYKGRLVLSAKKEKSPENAKVAEKAKKVEDLKKDTTKKQVEKVEKKETSKSKTQAKDEKGTTSKKTTSTKTTKTSTAKSKTEKK